MNRLEIIGLFTAMEVLADNKQYEGLERVIKDTLAAAKGELPVKAKPEKTEKKK
ncbi:MAG: hypothetical protein FWH20_01635 [Oscillospiraceae bacterium]|nr:hypothetical protein [Oscillospiraceae bacterium]